MAKGYWIAHVDVIDADSYKLYIAANGKAFARHGGRFLVRGGTFDCPEGTARARTVVIEFPSLAAARDCYADPDYVEAARFRWNAALSDLIIIEGYDGPQSGFA